MKQSIKNLVPDQLLAASRPWRRSLLRAMFKLSPDKRLTPIQRYMRDGWDDRIRKDLPLTECSTALDFGGYLGHWASDISGMYGCHLHVFEPVPEYAIALKSRFARNFRVTVHPYGVGIRHGTRVFQLSGDATGQFSTGISETVEFKSARHVAKIMPAKIELAAINIEGGEYELIPALFESGLLRRIELIFVQFHRIWEEGDNKAQRARCRDLLSDSHELLWNYDFVWEAWSRRPTIDCSTTT